VNIQIMRLFTKMRKILLTHRELFLKLEEMQRKMIGQDKKIEELFDYLRRFVLEQGPGRKKLGFKQRA
jgi:hypothetical protein